MLGAARWGANMHLNGWQRIGIVASVCWIIVGFPWINIQVIDDLARPVSAELARCLDARSVQPNGTVPKDTDWGPCMTKHDRDWELTVKPRWAEHYWWTALYTLPPSRLSG
jgi:hypothetical protein